MRVIGVSEFGGPEVLREFDLPLPTPGPGEVRVRVRAACVNPTDVLNRSGANPRWAEGRTSPWVPGIDFSGVVDALGPGVDGRLGVGDEVVGMKMPSLGEDGSYADFVVADAASVVAAPRRVDLMSASTLLMNALTARMSLDILHLSRGQVLAVTGAAGTLGGYITQLAKHDGLQVIADAAPYDHDRVSATGADVIVERGPQVAARILERFPGGVDGLVDGSVQLAELTSAIKPGGHMVITRWWTPPDGLSITVTLVLAYERVRDTAALTRIVQLADEGILTTSVAEVFPAARAADAHRTLEAGGVRGRLVLDFGPS